MPIPKISSAAQKPYEVLVDFIQFGRVHGLDAEADTLEEVVDILVFGLYFEAELKAASCYINDRISETLKPFEKGASDEEKASIVRKAAAFCLKDEALARAFRDYKDIEVVRTVLGKT